MHALICCVGSAGDVHPFVAIGLALQQRGHAVELCAAEYFRERVERAGLAFLPAGRPGDFERVLDDAQLWDRRQGFRALFRHMAPALAPAYDDLLKHIRPGETVLVGSSLAFAARLAQERLGVPMATVHLSPSVLFSAEDPPICPGMGWLRGLPPWAVRALQRGVERVLIDPAALPVLAPLRASLGLPPVRRVMGRWLHSPQCVICAWPAWFAPLPADAPPHSVCTGFARWAAPGVPVLEAGLEAFLQAGAPPIVFTPGSAMAQGRAFFERALAASATLQRRAVLVTPFRDQLRAALPAFAWHAPYAPYDLLAPRAAAFVHHGGIGTCAQALAAGVPQLITPFAHDQFDNAARLVRLGVGRSVAPGASPRVWSAALAALLADAAIAPRCRERVACFMAERSPAEQAAERIEALKPH